MTTGFAAIQQRKNELIRKGLQGSVFIAPYSAPAVTAASLFDPTSGDLTAVPAGYSDLGWLDDTGAKFARAVKQTDITSWGSTEPTRSDITSDTTTMVINPQETNQDTIALYLGVDAAGLTPGTNGVLDIPRPPVAVQRFYRVLAVSVDEDATYGEIAICRFMPRAQVTSFADQSLANGATPILWGVTMTAYEDSVLGFDVEDFFGGAGWKAMTADASFPTSVTVTTVSASTALVATVGTFSAAEDGLVITGAGIPVGATLTYVDATHATLSVAATASATGVVCTIA